MLDALHTDHMTMDVEIDKLAWASLLHGETLGEEMTLVDRMARLLVA